MSWDILPEGWTFLPLKESGIQVIDGDRGENYPSSGDFDESGYCLFLSAKNVTKRGFVFDECQFITREKDRELRKGRLEVGDLVLTTRGTVGNIGFFDQSAGLEAIRINSGMVIIRNSDKQLHTEFLYILFRSQVIDRQVDRLTFGSAQPQLTVKIINDFKIPIPPLSEQKKIAHILSTWDRAIETVERLIENSKAQKKALMQQLLTGKRRFPGFEGEWRKVRLSDVAKITMGSSPKSETYNEIGEGLPLIQGNADIQGRVSTPRVFTSAITKECHQRDILLSVRAPVGAIARSQHHACIGRGIAAITATNTTDQGFLFQTMLALEPLWSRLSQGSTFDAVNSKDVKGMRVFVPISKEEQRKVAAALELQDFLTENLKFNHACLLQQKKALMQQLLTGRRRVRMDRDEV